MSLAICALTSSCIASAGSLSHGLEPGGLSDAPNVIVLPTWSVPLAFNKSELTTAGSGWSTGYVDLDLLAVTWSKKTWSIEAEDLPEFNVGTAISEACVEALREHAADFGDVRTGPGWTMTPEEFAAAYGGTHDSVVIADRTPMPFHTYRGQGPLTHDRQWVTSKYPLKPSPGARTWLLEPLLGYVTLGPSGFSVQLFFHLYDLETGAVLARKYPGNSDVVRAYEPIGQAVDGSGDTEAHTVSSGSRVFLGLLKTDDSSARFTDADILKSLDEVAQRAALKGMRDLGLVE